MVPLRFVSDLNGDFVELVDDPRNNDYLLTRRLTIPVEYHRTANDDVVWIDSPGRNNISSDDLVLYSGKVIRKSRGIPIVNIVEYWSVVDKHQGVFVLYADGVLEYLWLKISKGDCEVLWQTTIASNIQCVHLQYHSYYQMVGDVPHYHVELYAIDHDDQCVDFTIRYVRPDDINWEYYPSTKINLEFKHCKTYFYCENDDGKMMTVTIDCDDRLSIIFDNKERWQIDNIPRIIDVVSDWQCRNLFCLTVEFTIIRINLKHHRWIVVPCSSAISELYADRDYLYGIYDDGKRLLLIDTCQRAKYQYRDFKLRGVLPCISSLQRKTYRYRVTKVADHD